MPFAVKKAVKNCANAAFRKCYWFLMLPAHFKRKGRRLYDARELELVHQALLSQNLFSSTGRMVPEFERRFATEYGVPYAVSSTSGTAALHTALGALELDPGDEVITAPITDMGTIIPILYQNAVPVFADIDSSYTMDPKDVEKKITSRTKAIIAVHLFGNTCDMDALADIARRRNIVLIEDCAQAHLTEYKGRYAGTIGDIGCFSFQQSKHMSTGDGGMTITSSKALYEKMKLFVDKNYSRKGWGARAYGGLAPNYRMNELTAAVGLAQLGKVKSVIVQRRELGRYMNELIKEHPELIPPPATSGATHSFWLYPLTLKTLDADIFAGELIKKGIKVLPGYTVKPIYLCGEALTQKKTYGRSQCPFSCKAANVEYEYREGLCPVAEESLRHLVCVPMDESWTTQRVQKTAQAFFDCLKVLSAAQTVPVPLMPREETIVQKTRLSNKLKVAVIGCGYIGKWHLEAYQKNPEIELAAFVDMDLARANDFARSCGAKSYKSCRELLSKEKITAASICTIPSTHKQLTLDLLDAGVNVLCEKPLAVSSIQAREMVNKAEQKKLLLLAAYKFRFFEEVIKAKELLRQGGMGRVLNFRLMFAGYQDMSGTWFSKKDLAGGGVIMDNGSHALDLARFIFGEVESVIACPKSHQGLEVEDTAKLELSFKDGATGTIDLSWSLGVAPQSYLEIYCRDGAMLLSLSGIKYRFKTWNDWRHVPNKSDQKQAFKRQVDHFLDAVKSKKTSVINNLDGLKSQELIEAAYSSINRAAVNR